MKETEERQYFYDFQITKVVDGDTIYGLVTLKNIRRDLGFNVNLQLIITKAIKVRLYGINAPEMRGEEKVAGLAAKKAVLEYITAYKLPLKVKPDFVPKKARIQTLKDKKGKYGRWIGIIWVDGSEVSLNEWLVENGYAIRKNY